MPTGTIEFLMIHLDEKQNAQKALRLLLALQEVAVRYNSQDLKIRVLKNYETLLSSYNADFIENI